MNNERKIEIIDKLMEFYNNKNIINLRESEIAKSQLAKIFFTHVKVNLNIEFAKSKQEVVDK